MGTVLMEKLLTIAGHVTKNDLMDILQAGSTYGANFAKMYAKANGLTRLIAGRKSKVVTDVPGAILHIEKSKQPKKQQAT